MPGKRKGPTPQRQARIQRVLEMRTTGIPFYKIGEALGRSKNQAINDYRDGIQMAFRASLDEHFMTELDRLEQVHRRAVSVMNSREVGQDEAMDAARVVLKCSEQRAKLLGLNSAIKFEVNDTTYTPLMELAATILDDDGR